MAPRRNKRQQRELEELEVLGKLSNQGESSEEKTPIEIGKSSLATFANFLEPEDVVNEEQDESEDTGSVKPATKSKKRKKKKKPAQSQTVEAHSAERSKTTSVPAVSKSEKKALKKARAKERKAGMDELDEALAELSLKYPSTQKPSSSTPDSRFLADLLSVSLIHLDADAEMRRFFGAKVVQADKSSSASSPAGAPSSARRQLRSHLTRPPAAWWHAKQREGLSARPLAETEVREMVERHGWEGVDGEERWWTVEYSKKYKSATKAFMQTVMLGDPQGFWELLRLMPWHADTLLQMAEVYRHREEYSQAVDFVDRAIFAYERSLIGSFNFTSGLNRLDFDRVENRPFFLAIHRQVVDLQRRGCVRAAFEFARLLYVLDPWTDPHGALLHLDLLALKARMTPWLLDVYDLFAKRREADVAHGGRMNPSLLPGWAYARALAMKILEDEKKSQDHSSSTHALKEAIASFPSVVPLLADKIDTSIPASARSHRDCRIETDATLLSTPMACLHLLSHLYAQRSAPVWKEPSHSSWFASAVADFFSQSPASLPVTKERSLFVTLFQTPALQHSTFRHIIVLESAHRRLLSFVPRSVLSAKLLACDPLVPPTAISVYDDTFFRGVEDTLASSLSARGHGRRGAAEGNIQQLLAANPEIRVELEALLAADPQLAQQFPGGVADLADLPPEAIEDMFVLQAMQAGAVEEGGGMPGELPGFEDVPEEEVDNDTMHAREDAHGREGEDETEDWEDASPFPRVLRSIFARFWGRPSAEDNDSSSDEEPLPRDNDGVD